MSGDLDNDMPSKEVKIYCDCDGSYHEKITTKDAVIEWHCKGICKTLKITIIKGGKIKDTKSIEQ